jgi:hypothetical protein
MRSGRRQVVLNKGSQKFVFRYNRGNEDGLLDALMAQAKDPRTDFDWFDAAVLSYRLAQRLISEADGLLTDGFSAGGLAGEHGSCLVG